MSTRATVHFKNWDETQAIVYRHCDGYPTKGGLKDDLNRFLKEIKANLTDTRFSDACFLAARFVVWQAAEYVRLGVRTNEKPNQPKHICDFLSVGIMMQDPGDIEYRYTVDCDNLDAKGMPKITWEAV